MWAELRTPRSAHARGYNRIKKMKSPKKLKRETKEVEWLYDHRDEIEATRRPVFDKNGNRLTPAETREQLLKRRQSVSDRRY